MAAALTSRVTRTRVVPVRAQVARRTDHLWAVILRQASAAQPPLQAQRESPATPPRSERRSRLRTDRAPGDVTAPARVARADRRRARDGCRPGRSGSTIRCSSTISRPLTAGRGSIRIAGLARTFNDGARRSSSNASRTAARRLRRIAASSARSLQNGCGWLGAASARNRRLALACAASTSVSRAEKKSSAWSRIAGRTRQVCVDDGGEPA